MNYSEQDHEEHFWEECQRLEQSFQESEITETDIAKVIFLFDRNAAFHLVSWDLAERYKDLTIWEIFEGFNELKVESNKESTWTWEEISVEDLPF